MMTVHATPAHVRAMDTPPAYVAQVNAPQGYLREDALIANLREDTDSEPS